MAQKSNDTSTVKALITSLKALAVGYDGAYTDYLEVGAQINALNGSSKEGLQKSLLEALTSNTFIFSRSRCQTLANNASTYEDAEDPMAHRLLTLTALPIRSYLELYGNVASLNAAQRAAAKALLSSSVSPYLANTLKPELETSSGDLSHLKQYVQAMRDVAQYVDPGARTTLSQVFTVLQGYATRTTALQSKVLAAIDSVNAAVSAGIPQLEAALTDVAAAFRPENAQGQAQALDTQVTGWRDDLVQGLHDQDAALGNALEDLRVVLAKNLAGFKADLLGIKKKLATTPPYPELSFKLNRVACTDKQDSSTSSHDWIYVAWMAIGPDGVLSNGIREIGKFDEKDDNSSSKVVTLKTFSVQTDPSFKKFYMVLPALFERDGKLDFDDKWSTAVDAVQKLVDDGIKGLKTEAETSLWLDGAKDKIRASITNSLLKWNEDDLLAVKRYSVWRATAQSLFAPTSRDSLIKSIESIPYMKIQVPSSWSDDQVRSCAISCGLDVNTETSSYATETYANDPKDITVGKGRYSVQTCWEYHD